MNDDGTFSYSLNFEGAKYGYTVQARVNMGWCGSGDNWIRFGDYFNDFAHSFEMEHDAREATKDVNLVKYKDPSRPDVDEHLGKLDIGHKRTLSISLIANLLVVVDNFEERPAIVGHDLLTEIMGTFRSLQASSE